MGLTNRLATKLRTADKTEAINLPEPYEDRGAVQADAIIRAACATISQLKLSSSGARGSDFLGMRESRTAQASVLSVEHLRLRQWTVSLGAHTVGGWTTDWQLDITIQSSPSGQAVSITTPAALTRDGTLVNKAAHAELRDLILTGLRAGRLPQTTAETAISKDGLRTPALAPFQSLDAGTTRTDTMHTSLTVQAITDVLDQMPYPTAEHGHNSRSWQLGPAGELATRTITASLTDDRQRRTITVRYNHTLSDRPAINAIASSRAIGMKSLLWHRLRTADPAATDETTEQPIQAAP